MSPVDLAREAESRKRDRRKSPANAANNPSIRRDQHEIFDLALRLAETLYSLPPAARLGYINHIIGLARDGHCPKIRKILTNPSFIRPDKSKKHLFYRGQPGNFCTIAQAANRYCLTSPWNASVAQVVRGEVPEPPTGEVMDEECLAA
jgi:hypothetical protein